MNIKSFIATVSLGILSTLSLVQAAQGPEIEGFVRYDVSTSEASITNPESSQKSKGKVNSHGLGAGMIVAFPSSKTLQLITSVSVIGKAVRNSSTKCKNDCLLKEKLTPKVGLGVRAEGIGDASIQYSHLSSSLNLNLTARFPVTKKVNLILGTEIPFSGDDNNGPAVNAGLSYSFSK